MYTEAHKRANRKYSQTSEQRRQKRKYRKAVQFIDEVEFDRSEELCKKNDTSALFIIREWMKSKPV